MDGLSTCWPSPRPSRLGGRTYRVPPFRLRDLAELEQRSGLADLTGDDPPPLGDPYREAARDVALWADWPTPLGSPADAVARHGGSAVLWLLEIVAPRCVPAIGDPAGLLAAMSVEEARDLVEALDGEHPASRAVRTLNALDGLRPDGGSGTFLQAMWRLACETGLSLDAIGDLPLPTWRAIVVERSPFKLVPTGDGPNAIARRQAAAVDRERAILRGEPDPGPFEE